MRKTIFTLLIIAGALLPLPSLAFNPNFILTDRELEDYSSMSVEEIKQFLAGNGSFLAYYADFWPESWAFMDASEIIAKAAEQFKINPKFLLVLLEKEQSLISLKKPAQKRLDWALGYAVCDKCRLSHPLVAQYKGFAKQVYFAAKRIRETYLADLEQKGKTSTGMGPGITKKIDKKYVTPANNATALLYTYTPHILGNRNFYLLWRHWFLDLIYPDGSLLQDAKTGTIYLIENGTKRPMASENIFNSEFGSAETVLVTAKVLAKYPDGEPFTEKDGSPDGSLLQNKETGGVYWVAGETKHPIWDKSVLAARFPKAKITKISEDELLKYETGEPVKLLNGTLVKSADSPSIFIISQNKLRPILSEDTFLTFGWDWKNVVKTTPKVLSIYEQGEPIAIEGEQINEPELPAADSEETQPEEQEIAFN